MSFFITHPGQELFQQLSDEEKHLLLEAASNPVLRTVLTRFTASYKNQQLELESLSPEELPLAYQRLTDAKNFTYNLEQFFKLVETWHQNIHR